MARVIFTTSDRVEAGLKELAKADGDRSVSSYVDILATKHVDQELPDTQGRSVEAELLAAAKQLKGGPAKLLAVARDMLRPKRRSAA